MIKDQEGTFQRSRSFLKFITFIFTVSPKETIFSLFLTLIVGVLPFLKLVILQNFIDDIVTLLETKHLSASLLVWASAFFILSIMQIIVLRYSLVFQDNAHEHIKENMQQNIIQKAQSLPLISFEENALYDQLKRIQAGIDQRFYSTMTFLFRVLTSTITLGSLLFYFSTLTWTIPILVGAGTLLFCSIRIIPLYAKYILQRRQTEGERKLDYLADLLTGKEAAAELRLFDTGAYLLQRWRYLNSKLRKQRLSHTYQEFIYHVISTIGLVCTLAIALFMIVDSHVNGGVTIGALTALITGIIQFQSQTRSFLWGGVLVVNDLKYMDEYFDFMDLQTENFTGLVLGMGPIKEIVFEDVSFWYPHSKAPVLQHINLRITAGDRIALVGENGAGKTTLIKLLLGFYKPTNGRILINGLDAEKLNPKDLRARISALFQDFQRYSLTVKENIAVGQMEKIDIEEQISKTAHASEANSFIQSLPNTYDTLLGKDFDGVELSQGQWQKIAIARAYLRNSDVLVLDEPTAALDPEAEVAVYKHFQKISQEKTVLLISHRMGVTTLANRIIVLKNGMIVEQGSPSELTEMENGHYAKLFRSQAEWYTSL
ncbi:ABC transporter ATP-binding protein [Aureibacillus halotolerans]|uniref:ATP-binding cassette subfamily B protein n=1 Tax=Aureibacillus halotolerans TaxID=1508390 RepID=A0A4R6U891_9BACI|nr:ABC transporter ATP-binding protein [Aureibacillus halotolerans]TDQ42016.1 ATP-binding cassette subfamily B protein [Aureibacillus halotolerans]